MKRTRRKKGIVIAIDGPAGAGKSSVAKRLAKALGYGYVDTGAIYRAVALLAREKGILPTGFRQGSPEDAAIRRGEKDAALQKIAEELLAQKALRFAWQDEAHQTLIAKRDVSSAIREENNSQAASSISARPGVRASLLEFQRQLGKEGGAVLEGRDTGTVVFPDAELKVFLSATPKERARRRLQDLQDKGSSASFEEVLAAIEERDRQDEERAAAPLRKADDAHVLDTTGMSIDAVVAQLGLLVRRILGR